MTPHSRSVEIPISPSKAPPEQPMLQDEDKQTTEYTWPESLMDVDVSPVKEPPHTTLILDNQTDGVPMSEQTPAPLAKLGEPIATSSAQVAHNPEVQ